MAPSNALVYFWLVATSQLKTIFFSPLYITHVLLIIEHMDVRHSSFFPPLSGVFFLSL